MSKNETVGFVSREQLLGAKARRFHEFPVQGLPGKVRIRSLTEKEKSAFEARFLTKKGEPDRDKIEEMRRRLIVLTVVDADGNPTLTNDDVVALQEIDGAITTAIQAEAQRHCGFGNLELEEARKN